MRSVAKRLFRAAPAPLHEALLRQASAAASSEARFRNGQLDMFGSIRNLAENGFVPGGIVDIGANVGAWTRAVAPIFPATPIHMVEARPNLEPAMLKTVEQLPQASYTMTLLGPRELKAVPFHVAGTGSSVLEEQTNFKRGLISLPMKRLDDLPEVRSMNGPLFVKMDVQGYELAVLDGSPETLERTEVILAEVALLPFNKGAPLMHEVIAYLAERDFLSYDICGALRRSSDMALAHTDIIFVRSDSELRAHRQFFRHEPPESSSL